MICLTKSTFKEHSGFLAYWQEVDKAPKEKIPEGSYLILYPGSLILSSKETICLKLFNGFAIDEFSVEIFDFSAIFLQAYLPVVSQKALVGSRTVCLEIIVPDDAQGERAVIWFRLKSQVFKMRILNIISQNPIGQFSLLIAGPRDCDQIQNCEAAEEGDICFDPNG